MKKREWEQFKNKPEAELKKGLADFREKLWTLKTDLAAGKVKNVREIKKLKRNIAKTLTLLHQYGRN